MFSKIASLTCFLLALPPTWAAAPATYNLPQPWSKYNNNAVFLPSRNASSWRTLYARTTQLADNSLLLSWEDYDPNVAKAYWPVYQSVDGGVTFQPLSRVQDTVNGWGAWYQPNFYVLPQDFAGYKKGAVLLAGVSTPRDLSQAYIELYVSTDNGKNWAFLSHIVYGSGPETVTNGNKAVWEPFVMFYNNNQIVCYYSTQTDSRYAQKLSHKTTSDLKNWSNEVDDVAIANNYPMRPGMATVAYSPISQKYVMTFEYCGGPIAGGCPVYHKVATNPLNFGPASLAPIIPNDGNLNPNGSPYIVWTNVPGTTGQDVFVMNGNSREELFINTDAVNPN